MSEEHLNAEEKLSTLLGNTARGLSTIRGCEVDAMAKGNIPSTDGENSSYCIYSRIS